MKPSSWSPATKAGLSVSIATGLYGISFGALSVAAGFDVWQSLALSTLMFAGGQQFAFIGIIGAGGAPLSATIAASLLGLRNALYAMQLAILIAPGRAERLALAQITIDESTAVAVSQPTQAQQRHGLLLTGVATWVLWSGFTVVGALAGQAIGDPSAWGLDGAVVAAFLGLLWPRLSAREPFAIAVLAAVTTLVAVPWLPVGIPILVAAIIAALVTLRLQRRPA